jgi:hypothetical protein
VRNLVSLVLPRIASDRRRDAGGKRVRLGIVIFGLCWRGGVRVVEVAYGMRHFLMTWFSVAYASGDEWKEDVRCRSGWKNDLNI